MAVFLISEVGTTWMTISYSSGSGDSWFRALARRRNLPVEQLAVIAEAPEGTLALKRLLRQGLAEERKGGEWFEMHLPAMRWVEQRLGTYDPDDEAWRDAEREFGPGWWDQAGWTPKIRLG